MKYDFKLDVTKSHILRGRPKSSGGCALALAANEFFAKSIPSLMGLTEVWVSPEGLVRVLGGETVISFRAAWAERFVKRFDSGQHVAAQTFYYVSTP